MGGGGDTFSLARRTLGAGHGDGGEELCVGVDGEVAGDASRRFSASLSIGLGLGVGNSDGDEPRVLCRSSYLLYMALRDRGPSALPGLDAPDQDVGQGSNGPLGKRFLRMYVEEVAAGRSVGLTFDPLSRQHALVEILYRSRDFHSRRYFAVSALLQCGNQGYDSREYALAPPPLPVATDAPLACIGGALYWMSDPRLGRSRERAVVSFDAATRTFDAVACPPCIAAWSGAGRCRAFVVELGAALCAVLADPEGNSLDVWRLERGGGWGRAWVIRLDGGVPPGYDLATNDVVPLAVDTDDGRILLSAGRRMGLYDPAEQTVEDLRSLDGMEDGAVALVPMVYEESLACYPSVARARRLSFR